MNKLWLMLKTRVKGYATREGTWVEAHTDKRPERKIKPPSSSTPASSDDQLNLFSLLDQPSKVPAPSEPVPEISKTEKPKSPPKTPKPSDEFQAIDYSLPWADVEARVPEFGAKETWKPSQRKQANEEALAIMRKAERTEKLGKGERKKLAAYSGEGGIGDSLNEYYTPPKVATAMWYLLRRFGLEHGHVLEPCAGSGVFQETKPAGLDMTAVEWSSTSARINALLHPDDHVEPSALEHFVSADASRYDAIIGNVPFGVRGAIAGFDKPNLGKAEDYFVDTCLDKTKEGGLMCLVVPHGIATNPTSRSFRKRVMAKAEVVGLHRLPNTAFAHSGTAVVTDILLLRKRPSDVANGLGVLDDGNLKKVGVWDEAWLNGALLDDPIRGHLHGTAQANWRGGYDVAGDMTSVPEAIATMPIPDLPESSLSMESLVRILDEDPDSLKKAVRASRTNPYPELELGTTKLINGQLYLLQGDPRRWHKASEIGEAQYAPSSKEGQALALGERLRLAADAVRDGLPISDREQLRTDVNAYVSTHGNPNGDATLVAMGQRDPRFVPLMAAINSDGRLSDLLEGNAPGLVVEEGTDWENFDDVAKALLGADGRTIKPDDLAESWNGEHTSEEVLQALYASDRYAVSLDGNQWGLREDLTAGDLYPKLDAHDAALKHVSNDSSLHAQLTQQRQWLIEAIQPKTLEEVEVSLRSGFVPEKALSAFLSTKTWGDGSVKATFHDGVYDIKVATNSGNYSGLSDWYDKYLNRLTMQGRDWDDIPKREQEFQEWLATSEYREETEEQYNRSFNSFKPKRYGDQPVYIPGWNSEMALNSYHHPTIRWALEEGKGILAPDVGLGKTPLAIAIVAKLREAGKARRPVVVVPKSLSANWAAEIEKFRPGSKVHIIGETHTRDKDGNLKAKSDSKVDRDKKWLQITQNDYDYILVTQPAFNDIDVDPIVKGGYVKEEFWTKRAEKMDKATDRKRKEIIEKYEQAMADKDFRKRTNAIYWNDLGVDCLIADEAHGYKNLFTARSRRGETPKFLGGSGFAKRALDMNHKTQWLRSQQDGKGVYFLTATPTKNSPLEVYSMLSHIAPEAFSSRGIRHEEDFIDRYCQIEQQQVLGTDGTIAESPVVVGFKNMDELRSIMGRYIYRKTAEDVGLKLPEKQVQEHFVDMTAEQHEAYQELREQASKAGSPGDKGDGHIFSIMDKMGKAAMDLSLLDPVTHSDAASPKYDQAIKTILANHKEGGQVVFADQVAVHSKIKNKLIAEGMDPKSIGIVNAQEAPDGAKRQNLADQFVNGKLKVIIGNTATMGEGMNLQRQTADIHHLDIPWEPASIQQRNGRGLRQGNTLGSVRLHTYLAKRSFDGYRWQTMSGKRDWMDQLWSGGDRIENPAAQQGVMGRDEMLILMSENPEKAKDELEKNTALQMEKYTAIKKKGAADTFRQYIKAKMNHAALKDQGSKSAHMLKMRIGRLHEDLNRNEHFENKHLLKHDGPILLNGQGHAFHPGAAFLMEGGGKGPASVSADPTTWNVSKVNVDKREVTMRPVGYSSNRASDTGETTFDLQQLESGVSPTDPVSAGAELRHLTEHLTHPVALKRFPKEMIEEHLPAIQDRLRSYMAPKTDYEDEASRDRKDLWGRHEGNTHLERIFPGSKGADTATYVVPNTDLMHEFYDEVIKEAEWNTRYGGGRGRHSNRQHRFSSAMYDFHDYSERDQVLQAYKQQKESRAAGLAKSQPRLMLFLKSFPGHTGRAGREGVNKLCCQ